MSRKQTCRVLVEPVDRNVREVVAPAPVHRLNYIGSKYQLLDWIAGHIKVTTGWETFEDKTIADLFAGTGIVSHFFRTNGCVTLANDAELYSSTIAHALSISSYTPACATLIQTLNDEITSGDHSNTVGFITTNYSPYETSERMFFTVENARRIDYIRQRLVDETLNDDERKFVMASLLLSADSVSNVPAVYGCYLKAFKSKAQKDLVLSPIHDITSQPKTGSAVVNCDVLTREWTADAVYMDPPYNNRQYSKNYFPLNMIAMPPSESIRLTGKTGIPDGCFLSAFCQKNAVTAFDQLISNTKSRFVFLSYSSEGIVPMSTMSAILEKYGDVVLYERPYKRFKSFEYNDGASVTEYLFCLTRTSP
jgi:adenine-specific DNA-methyltransferase